MDASLYYLREGTDGERQITFDELKARAEAGTLTLNTLVRPAETKTWVTAGSLAGLFPNASGEIPESEMPAQQTDEEVSSPIEGHLPAKAIEKARDKLRSRHYLVNAMQALVIGIFGWMIADIGWIAVGNVPLQKAVDLGLNWAPYTVGQGEYWRLFTSAVLCVGWFNLAMALMLLHWLGRDTETELGSLRLAAIALLCQAGGALASMYWMPAQYLCGFDCLFGGLIGGVLSHRLVLGKATFKQCGWTLAIYCGWVIVCYWAFGDSGVIASFAALGIGLVTGTVTASGPWWRMISAYAVLLALIAAGGLYAAGEISRSPIVVGHGLRISFNRYLRDIRRIMEAQEALDSALLSAVQARAKDKAATGPTERWLAMAQGYHDELAALRPAHPELQPLHELLLKHACLLKTEANKAGEFLSQPDTTTLTAYNESNQTRDAAFKDFIAARNALFAKYGLRPAGAPAASSVPLPPQKKPTPNSPAPPAKSSGGE